MTPKLYLKGKHFEFQNMLFFQILSWAGVVSLLHYKTLLLRYDCTNNSNLGSKCRISFGEGDGRSFRFCDKPVSGGPRVVCSKLCFACCVKMLCGEGHPGLRFTGISHIMDFRMPWYSSVNSWMHQQLNKAGVFSGEWTRCCPLVSGMVWYGLSLIMRCLGFWFCFFLVFYQHVFDGLSSWLSFSWHMGLSLSIYSISSLLSLLL